MTKASAKKIKDPLAKARGKCEYDHEVARRLSSTYRLHTGNHGDFDYQKFEKTCKLCGLSDEDIILGEPEHQKQVLNEIYDRFYSRTLFFYEEECADRVWYGLLRTNYLNNPGFLYLVVKNDLDLSETFFPFAVCLYSTIHLLGSTGNADPLAAPSSDIVNQSFAIHAPWGYSPDVDGSVRPISKDDPFYRLVATDPTFCAVTELHLTLQRSLEEHNVSEYFIPDATSASVSLMSSGGFGSSRIHLPKQLKLRDDQSRFRIKTNFRAKIVNQEIFFHKGQALYYEFPFALSEPDLLVAVRHRLELLRSGAVFAFSVRHPCPSNLHWLDLFGLGEYPTLFSGTSADLHGNPTTSDDVVKSAIGSVSGYHDLKVIESHDDAGNLVATQYVITRE